ncbi:MAG: hydrolase TatD [Flavobacteriaceae bacterium]|nr:hydrolase TatD [Flavobacteriaceae bacterium]|tara:strand:- start:1347 stop:2117 length:771 start_codon:yes stop_codon:yes gene_type:complete
MQLIDTHTHIYLKDFDHDREEVIKRAIDVGINHFFIPSIDSSYHKRMFELKKNFPNYIYLMMGLHPNYVKENFEEELIIVEELLSEDKFFAIGEIGIDLYRDKKYLVEQQKAFEKQILLAKSYSLPIVIHCREAFDEVFEIIEQHKGDDLTGIFHCFTGDFNYAQRAIDLNFKLGIGGVITFKNNDLEKVLQKIPIENIVLETDSPYLAPAPYRGKRNESSYLKNILLKLSDVYGISEKDVASVTTRNAFSAFKFQ